MIKLIMDAMLISVFWFIAIYTFKMERIKSVLVNKPKLIFGKKVVLLSKSIILLWMLLEMLIIIGSFFGHFVSIRTVLSMPIISHILYVGHLLVLFTTTRQITSKALETEKYLVKSEKRAVTFGNGLFVIGISIIIFYLQSLFWGELSYIYSDLGDINLLVEAIFDAILILIPGIMILINAIRFFRLSRIRILALRISSPILLLLSFGQTIITKVIVFYDFFRFIHRLFLAQFGVKIKVDSDDKLLIGSSMSLGSVNAKINVYYLTAYFSTLMILWTFQISPLPIPSTVYAEGMKMSLFFAVAILLFWVIEAGARSVPKLRRYLRAIFIPLMILLTVFPFYTQLADANFYTRATVVFSIYHKLALSLGSNKFTFFLCIVIMQASVAYILHIVTGEAHNDRHYYSILPVIGIVQLMMLSILYPIFLMIPPYILNTNKTILSIVISIFAVLITFGVGVVSHRFFTSPKSEWSHYVHEYWKDRIRVMIIVAIITGFSVVPIGATILEPIRNINIIYEWEVDHILLDDQAYVSALLQTNDKNTAYILLTNSKGNTSLRAISTEDGHKLWEKDFSYHYVDYKVWSSGQAVFIKPKSSGFSIVDLKTGFIQYDYSVPKDEVEATNIEFNDRAVLFSRGTEQFIYDMEYKVMELDTLGTNYRLLPGDQCALVKNNSIYLYHYERWEKLSGTYNVEDAELLYYDKNGLIVFGKEEIEQYNYYLKEKNKRTYSKVFQHIMTNNKDYYTKVGNQVAFYLYSHDEVYAYLFDTSKFTFKIIPLEQRLKDFKDYQKIKVIDDRSYFLYDTEQFTLIENQNIIARQWYQLPLKDLTIVEDSSEVVSEDISNDSRQNQDEKPDDISNVIKSTMIGQPIKVDNRIIWIENNGITHCIEIFVQ